QPPTGRYRRPMKQRLTKAYGHYGQRWQAETGFSMFKRRLGAAENRRSYRSPSPGLLVMPHTSNVMLLSSAVGFLQSNSRPLVSFFLRLDLHQVRRLGTEDRERSQFRSTFMENSFAAWQHLGEWEGVRNRFAFLVFEKPFLKLCSSHLVCHTREGRRFRRADRAPGRCRAGEGLAWR